MWDELKEKNERLTGVFMWKNSPNNYNYNSLYIYIYKTTRSNKACNELTEQIIWNKIYLLETFMVWEILVAGAIEKKTFVEL